MICIISALCTLSLTTGASFPPSCKEIVILVSLQRSVYLDNLSVYYIAIIDHDLLSLYNGSGVESGIGNHITKCVLLPVDIFEISFLKTGLSCF